MGVFGGDGRVHQSLMATGGARRILTNGRKTWSEGIATAPRPLQEQRSSLEDKMKEGQKNADQRHLAHLLDKSDL